MCSGNTRSVRTGSAGTSASTYRACSSLLMRVPSSVRETAGARSVGGGRGQPGEGGAQERAGHLVAALLAERGPLRGGRRLPAGGGRGGNGGVGVAAAGGGAAGA